MAKHYPFFSVTSLLNKSLNKSLFDQKYSNNNNTVKYYYN